MQDGGQTLSDRYTLDKMLGGRITVRQERLGYRFSLDALLVAFHVRAKGEETIVDLGTGCGIIPLVLAHRFPSVRIVGVEVQESLFVLARANVEANGWTDRITIVHQDLRELPARKVLLAADVVLTNPPYRRMRSGRVNPDLQKALARHEIMISLPEMVGCAHALLRPQGRFLIVYPASRTVDLLCELRSAGLEPAWIRMVHPNACAGAKLVLVEAVKGGKRPLHIAEPLYVNREDGGYSREVAAMLTPSQG